MARAMASPLRVKNTAYFDIAATLQQCILGSLRRPLAEGYALRPRPTSEPSLVLAATFACVGPTRTPNRKRRLTVVAGGCVTQFLIEHGRPPTSRLTRNSACCADELSAGRHGHWPRTDALPITSWMFGVGRRESDLACSCGWRVGPDGS